MIVCIDSGNSRIKWGVHDGARWLAQGAVTHADVAELSALPASWPRPDCVMLANVAGERAAEAIRNALGPWQHLLRIARPQAASCGINNRYKNPAQLGVDRWCALIGARSLVSSAALVVMAGTATTIDTLTADGCFPGGLILPGSDLMRQSLRRGTAGLPIADGRHVDWPDCTDDAIASGIVEAQAGAIERAWRRLEAPEKVCLIGGGNAEQLAHCLALPCRVTHNLPLEGLKQLALAAGAT